VRRGQLFKSASFRIAAAYVGLFSVSVWILAGLVYVYATAELQHEIRTRIKAESSVLRDEYSRGGLENLLDAVADRQRGHLVGGLDYAIFGVKGDRLFGDLPSAHCVEGWTDFTGPPDGDEPKGEMERVSVLVTPLPRGICLFVGDDIGKVRTFGSLILGSFGWVFLLTLVLAIGGGVFLSSRVLRRIEAINRTAEAIIEGDITRRIPRRGAPDDLDRLAATLNRMLDRMTGLMDALRHISNDVAHDLRTPLGKLRRTLEQASASATSKEQFDTVLKKALVEVDAILDTFGAMLRIAQIESGSRRGGFCRVSLSDLVLEVCDTFAPSIDDSGRSLELRIQPECWVQGDKELLVQTLANLLENAIAYTPEGAHIVVSLTHAEDEIVLGVADNGLGVPDDMRQSIFKRFFRADSSRTAQGNGLGLSIVAAVADLHAATVVANDNNPGLQILLTFPAAA
jgi:signal transduction histidine kinase